jgi:hypothetical protein
VIKVREFPALAMYPSWAEFVLVLHIERGGRVKTIKRITLCLVIGMVILMASQGALAFGVRPLVIDLDLKPGDTRDFEIILNPGSNDETVLLSLYQPIQLLDGNLAYQEPTPETFPSVNWVQLDKHEAKVYPVLRVGLSDKVCLSDILELEAAYLPFGYDCSEGHLATSPYLQFTARIDHAEWGVWYKHTYDDGQMGHGVGITRQLTPNLELEIRWNRTPAEEDYYGLGIVLRME